MINTVLLICCSWLLIFSLTPLMCSENLTRPEPEVGESRVDRDNHLPYYTAGFE